MKRRAVALLLLTAVAAALRFPATDFGLPDRFRPDEEYLVSRALGFHRDLNPHFAVYPALNMYVQHLGLRADAWLSGHRGDFRSFYAVEGGARAHWVGRLLSATFGTATVPATYLAGARIFGVPAAMAAATILTFAPIHVRESKYATTDALAGLLTTLALWLLFRVILDGRLRDSIAAGFVTGLAIATKYPAGAVLGGLAVAHLGARWRESRSLWRSFRDIRPWLALYTTIAAFLLGTPYFVLDWEQTVKDFEYQRGFLERGVGNPLAGWGWSWLFGHVFPDSLGLALASFLVIAFVWSLLRPRPGSISLAVYVVVAALGITASRYTFYRYLLTPLPGLVLMGGVLVSDAYAALRRRQGDQRAAVAIAASLILLLGPSLIRDYKLNRILARRDTRTIAREWIEANIPPGTAIAATDATTPYGKPQLGSRHRLVPFRTVPELRQQGIEWVLSDSSPIVYYSPGPTAEQLAELGREAELRFDRDPIKPGTPTPVFDQADAFYAPLQHASSMTRPGPRIRIWQLRKEPDAAP